MQFFHFFNFLFQFSIFPFEILLKILSENPPIGSNVEHLDLTLNDLIGFLIAYLLFNFRFWSVELRIFYENTNGCLDYISFSKFMAIIGYEDDNPISKNYIKILKYIIDNEAEIENRRT